LTYLINTTFYSINPPVGGWVSCTSVFTIGPFGPWPPFGPSGRKIGHQTKTVKELLELNRVFKALTSILG